MKINENPTSVIYQIQLLDVSVIEAQRLAEARQTQLYNDEKMSKYKTWSASGGDVLKTFGVDIKKDMNDLAALGPIKVEAVRHDVKKMKVTPFIKPDPVPEPRPSMLARLHKWWGS